jgi:peptidoglycan/LPS O-acetylase OafA/YrhL
MLPLYALVMARLTRGLRVRSWMRVELFTLAGLSAISTALEYVVFKPPPRWLDTTALGYAFWFALGMGMAVVSVGLGDRQRQPWPIRQLGARPVVSWLMALATYALLCAWLPATPFLVVRSQLFVLYIAFGLIAALLLAPAVFAGHAGGLPRRLLAHPVMAWLGLISYGIFLWHYVVTIELGMQGAGASYAVVLLGTLAITIPCAAASYYVVERPLLRLKYHRIRDVVLGRRPV